MLELGVGADLFRAVGWVFIAIVLIAVALALWLPKPWWGKAGAAAIVLGIASIVPMKANKEISQQQVKVDDYKKRYAIAKALFDERCKTAGEKVYKTVENVEGVLLLKTWVGGSALMTAKYDPHFDPMWPEAGLPYEYGGDSYISSFIAAEFEDTYLDPKQKMPKGTRGGLGLGRRPSTSENLMQYGYLYADALQQDQTYVRHQLFPVDDSRRVEVRVTPLKGKPSRYAVDFKYEINLDDRMHWIAGTTVTVSDTQTGDVLAERNSYAFEPGFGSKAGDRMPWLFSETCPKSTAHHTIRLFVDQVLKPYQGK
jgi:hypothetical protein